MLHCWPIVWVPNVRSHLIQMDHSNGGKPAGKPSLVLVVTVLVAACAAMASAVYFGGTGRTPLAMAGTLVFVTLGGLAFELARHRSL